MTRDMTLFSRFKDRVYAFRVRLGYGLAKCGARLGDVKPKRGRAVCPHCGKVVTIRWSGRLFKHKCIANEAAND